MGLQLFLGWLGKQLDSQKDDVIIRSQKMWNHL